MIFTIWRESHVAIIVDKNGQKCPRAFTVPKAKSVPEHDGYTVEAASAAEALEMASALPTVRPSEWTQAFWAGIRYQNLPTNVGKIRTREDELLEAMQGIASGWLDARAIALGQLQKQREAIAGAVLAPDAGDTTSQLHAPASGS